MSKEIKEDSNTDDIDSLLDEIAASNRQPDESSPPVTDDENQTEYVSDDLDEQISSDDADIQEEHTSAAVADKNDIPDSASDESASSHKNNAISDDTSAKKDKASKFIKERLLDDEEDDDERHPESFKELFENFKQDSKDQFNDFYTQFQKDRKRRKERKQLEFYGGKPPEDKSTRSLYIGFYAVKKFLSIIATTVFSILLIFIITGTIVGTVVTVYLLSFMDTTTAITLKEPTESFSSYIYSMNKETNEYDLVYRVAPTEHDIRIRTDINKLPDYVKYAFVCTEDERFYSHEGVDYKRTAAAVANLALKYIKLSDSYFGGSTITQQLIKNVTQDDEDTWDRKMREIFSAMKLEKKYTKDEILESYLDTIYFDRVNTYNMYGIEAAAIGYYGKPASELTIAEAATLSAIPQNPNKFNPTKDFDANKERKEYCLYKMFELGVISADEYEEAMNQEIFLTTMPDFEVTHPNYVPLTEANDDFDNPEILPWDVETAIKEFSTYLQEQNKLETLEEGIKMFNSGGYKLYLTTDSDVQAHLDSTYADWSNFFYDTDEYDEPVQSSCVVMDYKGHILGVAGKIGEKTTNLGFNNATEAYRQPGSTIKPVSTYGYAIENDKITWSSYFYDKSLDAGVAAEEPWPNNYDGKPSQGYYPVNYFLKRSINTLPAQIANLYGLQNVFDFATKKMHLELDREWDVDYSPLCVGGLHHGITLENLANAYMPYGNGGKYYKASIIAKAEDSKSGDVVIDNENRTPETAVSDETAFVMNKLLQKVVAEGTGTGAQLSNTIVAGKTGTTEDWRDIAFVGLTPDYLSAIWIGYSNGSNAGAIESANSARIWRSVFGTYANEHATDAKFPDCDTVIRARYCSSTGLLANSGCPGGDYGYYKSSNCKYCTSH